MKRPLKIYGWAWAAIIAATIVTFAVMIIYPSHHELAADPYSIEKIVKVDLPDIAFVESENNLDRSASRWDVFEHRGKFICKLPEETIMTLDDLCQTDSRHWRKTQDRNVYSYYDEGGIDGLYCVFCLISHDGFTINYEVEESEGIFILSALIVVYMILITWGMILLIVSLFRKNPKKS
ncbi:MAG: hypothetical protein J6R30_04755 [Bacteroidales bacterium]|nr:hypothetical protein [Bacteroidales bacterium]